MSSNVTMREFFQTLTASQAYKDQKTNGRVNLNAAVANVWKEGNACIVQLEEDRDLNRGDYFDASKRVYKQNGQEVSPETKVSDAAQAIYEQIIHVKEIELRQVKVYLKPKIEIKSMTGKPTLQFAGISLPVKNKLKSAIFRLFGDAVARKLFSCRYLPIKHENEEVYIDIHAIARQCRFSRKDIRKLSGKGSEELTLAVLRKIRPKSPDEADALGTFVVDNLSWLQPHLQKDSELKSHVYDLLQRCQKQRFLYGFSSGSSEYREGGLFRKEKVYFKKSWDHDIKVGNVEENTKFVRAMQQIDSEKILNDIVMQINLVELGRFCFEHNDMTFFSCITPKQMTKLLDHNALKKACGLEGTSSDKFSVAVIGWLCDHKKQFSEKDMRIITSQLDRSKYSASAAAIAEKRGRPETLQALERWDKT